MRRIPMTPRADWQKKVEEIGFTDHSAGSDPALSGNEGVYWDESVAYEFTAAEVDTIEAATNELHTRVMDAVDWVAAHPSAMPDFGIRPDWAPYVQESWRRRDPSIMGRFDLAFDPASGAVKMLEYNADTATLLIETSLVQWFWLQEVAESVLEHGQSWKADQFNSLHEHLIDAYAAIGQRIPAGAMLHCSACEDYSEELQQMRYCMDVANQVGVSTQFVPIKRIGWRTGRTGRPDEFVAPSGEPIRFLHKLYPWEWMAQETGGPGWLKDQVGVIEPPWKMIASNKALLSILHQLFPEHPHLLRASLIAGELGGDVVKKPTMGREGANVSIWQDGTVSASTTGSYEASPVIFQEFVQLPRFDGRSVVVGSWIVNHEACGMILRESEDAIVTNASRVVPHYFRGVKQ